DLKTLSPGEISDLMGISTKLGELNCDRYARWSPPFDKGNAKQAVLAFNGDVYMGLKAWNFSERDFTWAQKRVRILSGLYGLLRPLDLMQPYRLEMGTKFKNKRGDDLYQFWDNRLSDALAVELGTHRSKLLVNLASNEYFNAVDPARIDARVITPTFRDLKNGRYKFISFFAKKARGSMTRYIVKNRIETVKGMKAFDWGGYRFAPDLSRGDELVFLRDKIIDDRGDVDEAA
ncbi:MAG: peroxide stress protein YaaA, partial [Gammaproteobacteria bacterium]|nr:peroxide stress protein YaaA [Gammaproteobacteria bacterium]